MLSLTQEAAFHTIRSISNWFYWKSPNEGEHGRSLIHIAGSSSRFNTDKLRDAAAAARQGFWQPSNSKRTYKADSNADETEDYWTPVDPAFVPQSAVFDNLNTNRATAGAASRTRATAAELQTFQADGDPRRPSGLRWSLPMGIATLAAAIIRLQVGETSSAGLEQHIAGPLPLEIVNSSWLQAILAGCTWYMIGFVSVGLLKGIANRHKM